MTSSPWSGFEILSLVLDREKKKTLPNQFVSISKSATPVGARIELLLSLVIGHVLHHHLMKVGYILLKTVAQSQRSTSTKRSSQPQPSYAWPLQLQTQPHEIGQLLQWCSAGTQPVLNPHSSRHF